MGAQTTDGEMGEQLTETHLGFSHLLEPGLLRLLARLVAKGGGDGALGEL